MRTIIIIIVLAISSSCNRSTSHEAEARRFYEFVTTHESLIPSARNYYPIPVRNNID